MKTILLFIFFGFFISIIKNNDIKSTEYNDEDEEEFEEEDLIVHINYVLSYLNYKNKTEFSKKEFELIMKTLFLYDEKEKKEKNIEKKKNENNKNELNNTKVIESIIEKILENVNDTILNETIFQILNKDNLSLIGKDVLKKEYGNNMNYYIFDNDDKDDDDNDDDQINIIEYEDNDEGNIDEMSKQDYKKKLDL